MPRKERHKVALWKKARRGFLGYPVATVAFYGPDDKVATKVSVGIVLSEDENPAVLERWFSDAVDVRNDHDRKRFGQSGPQRMRSLEQLIEAEEMRHQRKQERRGNIARQIDGKREVLSK